jgi:glycosyltransferase involved in cell wall biosynthesis
VNILIVCEEYPAFDRSSYELRFSRLVYILAECHRVFLCPQDIPYMVNELGEEAVRRYRMDLETRGVEIFDKGLVSALRSGSFDIILFVVHTQASPDNLRLVRHWAPGARIVIDSVGLHFTRFFSRALLTGAREDYEQAEKIKDRELAAYRAADLVIAVSEQERQMVLNELPDKRVSIIPNIHPMGEFTPTDARDGKTLLFVGWGQYDPNVDAVLYFANEVLPLVLKDVPGARFRVIGGDYPEEVRRLHGGAIQILGRVPEMAPYLLDAHVSVAPLRYGSGVKGKIGEALSYGLPVVTTSVGLEGLGLTPGENVLAGDTAAEFAAHVVNLLRDPQLHGRISLAGWEFILDRFSEKAVRRQVYAVLDEIEHLPRPWMKIQGLRLRSFLTQRMERHVMWRLRRSRHR